MGEINTAQIVCSDCLTPLIDYGKIIGWLCPKCDCLKCNNLKARLQELVEKYRCRKIFADEEKKKYPEGGYVSVLGIDEIYQDLKKILEGKMRKEIKETCACGAVLECNEEVDWNHQFSLSERQAAFHKAHEPCRKNITPKEKPFEIKRYKDTAEKEKG